MKIEAKEANFGPAYPGVFFKRYESVGAAGRKCTESRGFEVFKHDLTLYTKVVVRYFGMMG